MGGLCSSLFSPTPATSTYTPPSYITNAAQNLISGGENLASTPYPYYGPTQAAQASQVVPGLVAPLTPNQQTGYQTISNLQGSTAPYYGAATGLAAASAAPITGQQFSPGAIGNYMSPYLGDVVNSAVANINQTNAQQQQQVLGNAIQRGAFGGDRAGIAQAELARQQNLANNATLANLLNTGYGQALGEFNTQQAFGAQQQLVNAQNLQNAASLFGNLGTAGQNAVLAQANAQIGAGQQQQQQQQQQLNTAYQQFQNQYAYPYQQLNFLGGLLSGTSGAVPGVTTQQAAQASPLGQTIGGIQGLNTLGGLLPSVGSSISGFGSGVGSVLSGIGSAIGSFLPFAEGGAVKGYADGGTPTDPLTTAYNNYQALLNSGRASLTDLQDAYNLYTNAFRNQAGVSTSPFNAPTNAGLIPAAPKTPSTLTGAGGVSAAAGPSGGPTGDYGGSNYSGGINAGGGAGPGAAGGPTDEYGNNPRAGDTPGFGTPGAGGGYGAKQQQGLLSGLLGGVNQTTGAQTGIAGAIDALFHGNSPGTLNAVLNAPNNVAYGTREDGSAYPNTTSGMTAQEFADKFTNGDVSKVKGSIVNGQIDWYSADNPFGDLFHPGGLPASQLSPTVGPVTTKADLPDESISPTPTASSDTSGNLNLGNGFSVTPSGDVVSSSNNTNSNGNFDLGNGFSVTPSGDVVSSGPTDNQSPDLAAAKTANNSGILGAIAGNESSGFKDPNTAVGDNGASVGKFQMQNPAASQAAAELGLDYNPSMRSDKIIAPQLAQQYLSDMFNYTGTVPGAIAAYNMGPGAYTNAVKQGIDPTLNDYTQKALASGLVDLNAGISPPMRAQLPDGTIVNPNSPNVPIPTPRPDTLDIQPASPDVPTPTPRPDTLDIQPAASVPVGSASSDTSGNLNLGNNFSVTPSGDVISSGPTASSDTSGVSAVSEGHAPGQGISAAAPADTGGVSAVSEGHGPGAGISSGPTTSSDTSGNFDLGNGFSVTPSGDVVSSGDNTNTGDNTGGDNTGDNTGGDNTGGGDGGGGDGGGGDGGGGDKRGGRIHAKRYASGGFTVPQMPKEVPILMQYGMPTEQDIKELAGSYVGAGVAPASLTAQSMADTGILPTSKTGGRIHAQTGVGISSSDDNKPVFNPLTGTYTTKGVVFAPPQTDDVTFNPTTSTYTKDGAPVAPPEKPEVQFNPLTSTTTKNGAPIVPPIGSGRGAVEKPGERAVAMAKKTQPIIPNATKQDIVADLSTPDQTDQIANQPVQVAENTQRQTMSDVTPDAGTTGRFYNFKPSYDSLLMSPKDYAMAKAMARLGSAAVPFGSALSLAGGDYADAMMAYGDKMRAAGLNEAQIQKELAGAEQAISAGTASRAQASYLGAEEQAKRTAGINPFGGNALYMTGTPQNPSYTSIPIPTGNQPAGFIGGAGTQGVGTQGAATTGAPAAPKAPVAPGTDIAAEVDPVLDQYATTLKNQVGGTIYRPDIQKNLSEKYEAAANDATTASKAANQSLGDAKTMAHAIVAAEGAPLGMGVGSQFANGLRGYTSAIARTFGYNGVIPDDPRAASQELDKIARFMANQQVGSISHNTAAKTIDATAGSLPNAALEPAAANTVFSSVLRQNVLARDYQKTVNAYGGKTARLGGNVQEAFEAAYPPDRYNKEQNALQDLMDPQLSWTNAKGQKVNLVTELMDGQITRQEFDKKVSKYYPGVDHLSRWLVN
jgi:Transglycosylase SLT domain